MPSLETMTLDQLSELAKKLCILEGIGEALKVSGFAPVFDLSPGEDPHISLQGWQMPHAWELDEAGAARRDDAPYAWSPDTGLVPVGPTAETIRAAMDRTFSDDIPSPPAPGDSAAAAGTAAGTDPADDAPAAVSEAAAAGVAPEVSEPEPPAASPPAADASRTTTSFGAIDALIDRLGHGAHVLPMSAPAPEQLADCAVRLISARDLQGNPGTYMIGLDAEGQIMKVLDWQTLQPAAPPPAAGAAETAPEQTAAPTAGGTDPASGGGVAAAPAAMPAPWTADEDTSLINLVVGGLREGLTRAEAMRRAADFLERPIEGTKYRLYTKLKDRLAQAEAGLVASPAPDPAPDPAPTAGSSTLPAFLATRDMVTRGQRWSTAEDRDLMQMIVDGLDQNSIALDLGIAADKVKARFDYLTGLKKLQGADASKWVRTWTAREVAAELQRRASATAAE